MINFQKWYYIIQSIICGKEKIQYFDFDPSLIISTEQFVCSNVTPVGAIKSIYTQENLKMFLSDTKSKKVNVEIPYYEIQGTNREDCQGHWSYNLENEIIYSGGGTKETDNLLREENYEDLLSGWPRPRPVDNFIDLVKVLRTRNKYYIQGNGNSRVSATWKAFERNLNLKEGYVFHCNVTEYKESSNGRILYYTLKILKSSTQNNVKVSIVYSGNEYVLRYFREGYCMEFKPEEKISRKVLFIISLPNFLFKIMCKYKS